MSPQPPRDSLMYRDPPPGKTGAVYEIRCEGGRTDWDGGSRRSAPARGPPGRVCRGRRSASLCLGTSGTPEYVAARADVGSWPAVRRLSPGSKETG
jgi:hypothetical protein